MKFFRSRIYLIVIPLLLLTYWFFLGPATTFTEKSKYFIIRESARNKAAVLAELSNQGIIRNQTAFSIMASSLGAWQKIKAGKYEIKKGDNVLNIARKLKNGQQAEMKLIINRIRTKEELAKLIAKNFEHDSLSVMRFLQANDSLSQWGVDTNTVFTMIIPDTYAFYWNTSLQRIFKKLSDNKIKFWQTNNRKEKAKALDLSEQEVYTLASIVDEETNYDSDKIKIASVYLNRLNKGMPLQACPTIKFAMKDFTITRIYEKYLSNPSPYNTYRRKGLPPGPICTPSPKTIDIILDAPKTNFLFFVAKSDFSGYHHFSSNFTEHNQFAKEYQKALDCYMAKKQTNPSAN